MGQGGKISFQTRVLANPLNAHDFLRAIGVHGTCFQFLLLCCTTHVGNPAKELRLAGWLLLLSGSAQHATDSWSSHCQLSLSIMCAVRVSISRPLRLSAL